MNRRQSAAVRPRGRDKIRVRADNRRDREANVWRLSDQLVIRNGREHERKEWQSTERSVKGEEERRMTSDYLPPSQGSD